MSVNYKYILGIGLFGLGFMIGIFLNGFNFQREHANILKGFQPLRENSQEYKFINPLILYKVPSGADLPEYQLLVSRIKEKADNLKKANKAELISVYYRDLNKGQWIGLDEVGRYTPASLLKIVVMMGYLKQSEKDTGLLSEHMIYTKNIAELTKKPPYDNGTNLITDRSYSVMDLINKMIIDSDNGATNLLLSGIKDDVLRELYSDLGLSDPAEDGRDFTISAQEYSYFFRILYGATYLNKQMSELALSILAKTEFKEGLLAGIPASITVAHKYGESVNVKGANITSIELHDCGIVYVPSSPYFLCIMTKGEDINNLKEVISDISKTIYENIN